jgi:hypothetical protein
MKNAQAIGTKVKITDGSAARWRRRALYSQKKKGEEEPFDQDA